MKNSQNKSLQPSSASGIQGEVMAGTTKKINKRPQARLDDVMAQALHLYCVDEVSTDSRAIKLGLKKLIPNRYFEAARRKLNGGRKRA